MCINKIENQKAKQFIPLILSSLLVVSAISCKKPLCNVNVTKQKEKQNWFARDFWSGTSRSELYESFFGNLFIMPPDLDLLQSPKCLDCKNKLDSFFTNAFAGAVADGLSTNELFHVVKSTQDANYIVYIKVSEVNFYHKVASVLSPFGLEDNFGYWVKVVDPIKNITVFGFHANFVSFTDDHIRKTARLFCSEIEKQNAYKSRKDSLQPSHPIKALP